MSSSVRPIQAIPLFTHYSNAFPGASGEKVHTLHNTWAKEARDHDLAVGEQNEASEQADNLRTYVSAFLPVFNMAVE